jgi:hypothetical protein
MKQSFIAFLSVLAAIATPAAAQSPRRTVDQTNAWLMYFGDHKFSKRLGVHAEAQWRRADVVSSHQQLLLRTGLNYHFSPQVFATLGYAFVETYPYGELPVRATFPEHRLWEQVQLRSQFGRVEFINRLRLEQRFVQLPVRNPELPGVSQIWVPGDAVYTNRARPMIRASVPFKGKTIEDGSLYVSIYEEPFISFGRNVGLNIFDQNRAYLALGYKVPKVGRLEIGYLNQKVFKADGIGVENNHTLQVGLASTIALRAGL